MVFKQPLVSKLKPHCFHLDSSLKRSSNIPNWLSRIPTQSSIVNSELLLFITIQYTIMNQAQKKVEQHLNYMIKQWEIKGIFDILNYITEHVTLFQLVDTVGDVKTPLYFPLLYHIIKMLINFLLCLVQNDCIIKSNSIIISILFTNQCLFNTSLNSLYRNNCSWCKQWIVQTTKATTIWIVL